MHKKGKSGYSKTETKSSSYREINMLQSEFNHASPYASNRITSCEYTYLTLIPKTLFNEFCNLSYIWFIFLLIIELAFPTGKLSVSIYSLISVVCMLLFSLGKNLVTMQKRYSIDATINESEVIVWRNQEFVSEKSKNLRVGNTVLIRKHDFVPADIIILSCSGGKTASVSMKNIIGNTELYEKHSIKDCSIFGDFTAAEIYQMISRIESVTVTNPSRSFNDFSAKIKLSGNPKIQNASVDNFIVRGSKLIGNDWMLGFVVYTGMETKVWFNSKRNFFSRPSKLVMLINKIQLVNLIIMITIVFISVLFDRTLNREANKYSITETIIWYLILYGNTVSLSLVISVKLSKNISAFLLKTRIRGLSINPAILQELGKVEYILTGKSGVVEDENLKVTNILIKDCLYTKRKTESEIVNNRYEIVESASPSKINNFIFSSFEELQQSIESEQISENNLEFIKAVAICCQSLDDDYNKKHISILDKAIKKTFRKQGISVNRMQNTIAIQYGKTKENYEIIGEKYKINSAQVMVRCESTESVLLYYKGDLRKMFQTLNSDSSNFCQEEILSSSILHGLRTISFGFRELSSEETDVFVKKLRIAELSPINIKRRIKSVFKKTTQDLIYVGTIGLEYYVNEKTKKSIMTLNNAGIKTWMISGESSENSLVACYSSGIFNVSTKLFSLTYAKSEIEMHKKLKALIRIGIPNKISKTTIQNNNIELNSLLESKIYSISTPSIIDIHPQPFNQSLKIKRHLTLNSILPDKQIQQKLINIQLLNSEISEFFLLIDAESLHLALSTQDNRKMLTMALFTAQAVCFSGLTPDQKVDIVNLLKNNFQFCPTVLAIGDGQANASMMDEAFISVQIDRHNKVTSNFSPDIIIERFSSLTSLILVHGHYTYIRLSKVILYSIYKETMICTVLFLYQFISGFSGSILIDFDLLILYELAVSIIPIVLIGVFEKDVNKVEAKSSSEIYKVGYFNIMMNYKNVCFYYFTGIFKGSLLHFFINFSLGYIINSSGMTEDFEVKGILCFILISVSIIKKTLINTSKFYLPTFISPILTILCFILIIYLVYSSNITDYQTTEEIILGQAVFWIIVSTLSSIFTAIYYSASEVFYRLADMKFKNRLEMFKNDIQTVFKDTKHWTLKSTKDILDLDSKTLVFRSEVVEQEYQRLLSIATLRLMQFVIASFTLIIILYSILIYTNMRQLVFYYEFAFIPGVASLIFLVLSFFKKVPLDKLMLVFYFFIISTLMIYSLSKNSYSIEQCIVTQVCFSVFSNFQLKKTALHMIFTFIASIIIISVEAKELESSAPIVITSNCIVLNIGISALCILVTYFNDRNKRNEYIVMRKSKIDLEKVNTILSYLLPDFVKRRVKDGIRYIAESKGTVSVLFCDIGDFDQVLETYSPQEITSFLDDIFGRFDKICEKAGVIKIETVGKTYLACAGLKDSDKELPASFRRLTHARRAIEIGFALIEESEKIFLKDGQHLKLKIGINTGPVRAGVVGYHKPQFSLVGDTVNTASRMASTLDEYNSIQISLDTFEYIGDTYGLDFTERMIEVKGKGELVTMIVRPHLPDKINRDVKAASSGSSFLEMVPQSARHSSQNMITSAVKLKTHKTIEYYAAQQKQINWKNKLLALFFMEQGAEKEFQETLILNSLHFQITGLLVSGICDFFLIIINILQQSIDLKYNSVGRLVYLIIIEIVTLLMLLSIKRIHKRKWCSYFLNALYFSEYLIWIAVNFETKNDSIIDMMNFYFRFLLMNFSTGLFFSKSLLSNIIIVIIWLASSILFHSTTENMIFTVFFIIGSLVVNFLREQKLREDFTLKDVISEEQEKIEQLLSQMMPTHVLNNLKQGIYITDKLNTVTVMYADIVGFPSWLSTKSSTDVVSMLSELFTNFDKNCVKHNVYKVHTIGDCYVAMGYIGDLHRNPAREAVNMINFALSLLEIIETTNKKCDCKLDMRIGMHTGAVIGGITGTNVVRYDIYGKDVQIANKMESNGLPGRIAISEFTKSLVEDFAPNEFNYEAFKVIKIGSESIKMFIANNYL